MYAASWRLGSHTDLDFICVSGFSPVLSANSRKRQYLNVRSSFGGLAADPPTQAGASSRKTIASSSQFLSKDQKYHLFKNKGKSKTDLSATYVQCFQFEDFQRKSWEWLGRPHIWPYLLCVGATWWRGGLWRNLFLSKFISHKFNNIFYQEKGFKPSLHFQHDLFGNAFKNLCWKMPTMSVAHFSFYLFH